MNIPKELIHLQDRFQVANCYIGRAGLINSGGASGENDLQQAVKTAVINKRATRGGLNFSFNLNLGVMISRCLSFTLFGRMRNIV